MTRPRLTALLLVLIIGSGAAQGAVSPPYDVVRNTAQEMTTALKANRATVQQDPRKLYDLVHRIVLPHFDFELISRWVLGQYWRQATSEQRQRFIEEFRTFLVRTYASALLEYVDDEIRYPPAPRVPEGTSETTVRTEVVPKTGALIPINYSMHLKPDLGWKVFDVTVDGISLVTNYRSTFASQVRDNGMDYLINDLSARNKQGKK